MEVGELLQRREITEPVVRSFYTVYNSLGCGFLERVYENALAYELRSLGMKVQQQTPIQVYYKDQPMGEYFADMLISDQIIVELKAVESLAIEHEAQLLNYLRATRIEIGLLLNFGPVPEVKRKLMASCQDTFHRV